MIEFPNLHQAVNEIRDLRSQIKICTNVLEMINV
jgi:hypothetical protein